LVGKDANQTEKKEAMTTALEYVKTDPAGRDPEKVQMVVIKQGYEPPQFTGHFQAWNDDVFAHGKSYEQIKKELRDENAGISFVQEELTKFSFDRKYPFSVLCQEELPDGIDPTRKEYYLAPDEFYQHFKISFKEYEQKPQWKRDMLKRNACLF